MGFHFLLQFINILNLIWISCFLQNIESIPFSNSTSNTPGSTKSPVLSEDLKFNTHKSSEVGKTVLPHVEYSEPEEMKEESTDLAETNANQKTRKNLLSSLMVPYRCDIEKKMCWLIQNQDNLVTLFYPITLFPNQQPPAEIGLKEFYSLVTKRMKQQKDSLDPNYLNSSPQGQRPSSDVHHRRKRDTQYSEANYNSQQEWDNRDENEGGQSFRAQRDVLTTSTEHNPTSTVGRTQRNVDPQAKQLKRSAETDDDESEDDDFGSPSPYDDYQQDEGGNYQPEKRFAGSETEATTPKSDDSSSKSPSQPSRREVMNPNYNYPLFANPDLFYPPQRMLSPYDGISYRSVDALPMEYMYANLGFWQDKVARNPRQYYAQRQASGYGRGWPSAHSYYQQYANRYQSPYPSQPAHQNAGHHYRQHHYPQQSSYNPYSYNYGQANKNHKSPARKPIETDAHMYYGQ